MRFTTKSGRMPQAVRISTAVLLVALLAVNAQAAMIRRATDSNSVSESSGSGLLGTSKVIPLVDSATTPSSSSSSTSKDATKDASKEPAKEAGKGSAGDTTSGTTATTSSSSSSETAKATSTAASTTATSSPASSSSATPTPTSAAPANGGAGGIAVSKDGENIVNGNAGGNKSASENATAASANPSNSSGGGGLSSMNITIIVVGAVIVASVAGIFVLRKWKFTNTSRRTRLEAPEYIRERSDTSDAAFLRHLRN